LRDQKQDDLEGAVNNGRVTNLMTEEWNGLECMKPDSDDNGDVFYLL